MGEILEGNSEGKMSAARSPSILVVIAAYQAAGTIARALTSVLAQTWTDWELIVVDDASSDATAAVAESAANGDPRIFVKRLTQNLGAAAAMNIGWRSRRAELVAILDADDVALPDRLAHQCRFLEGHPEVDVVGAAALFVTARGQYLRTVTRAQDHKALQRHRWYLSPFVHSTVVMRRGFLEAMDGYANGLRLGEDYDLWMRGFFAGGFEYANLPEALVVYQTEAVQRWTMIRASARVRIRAGVRENRLLRACWAATRILAEGAVEQTGIFNWLNRRRLGLLPGEEAHRLANR
jgi:glycosyltransferase involved in cell wall biosynthesis